MKKIIALWLMLTMLLALAACGGGSGPSQTGGADDPVLSSQELEDVEDALELLESLTPEGWDENQYGAYIYDVWDEAVLPDCFPAPPEGIRVEQTSFKDYRHDRLNQDYSLGPMWWESYEDYRSYGVAFSATTEQLADFVAGVEEGGLVGGMTEDGDWTYYHYYGGGWFMEIFARATELVEGYDHMVTVRATDSLFELPQSISGIPLPQCGVVGFDHSSYTIQDFTDGYEDVDFDLSRDTLPGEYYAAWFSYYCATNQDAMDYAGTLKDLGWEVVWETDGEYGYRCCLEKDGMYAVSNYYTYDCVVEVGFSDMVENLSY